MGNPESSSLDWKLGIIAFSILGFFAWKHLRERNKYLSDVDNVRYTITKIFKFRSIDGGRYLYGYFFFNKNRIQTKLDGDCWADDCTCDIKLNDYLWVKFNINKPSIYEVLPPCEFKPLKDSIPIPQGGIKEEMLKFYAK
jgi:hypothetical protein